MTWKWICQRLGGGSTWLPRVSVALYHVIREHPACLIILIIGVLLRLGVLLTSQQLVDGDEAVVGVMARHFLYQGESSLFFWGQPYGGGAAIEAHLAAVPFLLLGPSGVALKLVPLGFTLVSWVLSYVLVLRSAGKLSALGAMLFLVLATPALEWGLKARGGYAEMPFFMLLALIFLERIARDGEARRRGSCFALGITCGIAYYNLELIVPFLLVLALSLPFLPGQVFLKRPSALGFVALGALVGLAPVLLYNLHHGWINLEYVLKRGGGTQVSWERLWHAVTFAIPAFFQPRNVDGYPPELGARAVVETSLYGLLFMTALGALLYRMARSWNTRPSRARPLRRSRPRAAAARPQRAAPAVARFGLTLEAILAGHVLIHTGIFIFSDWSLQSPRYLLPIYPSLAILCGMTGARLLQTAATLPSKVTLTGLASVLAFVPPLLGLVAHLLYLQPARVVDDVYTREGRWINAMVSADSLPKAMELVRAAGIRRVRTTYFTQWRMIFESGEDIIASSVGLVPNGQRYAAFDHSVASASRLAYVIHKESYINGKLGTIAALTRVEAGDYWVYLPR